METAPHSSWQRLGDLLVARRIELNPRWRNRTRFAEEAGLHWRLLFDIERAKRTTFPAETLMAIEVAYRWQYGSIEKVLGGGDPLPLAAEPDPEEPHYGDPRLQSIMNFEDVPLGLKIFLVEQVKEGIGIDDDGHPVRRWQAS